MNSRLLKSLLFQVFEGVCLITSTGSVCCVNCSVLLLRR